MLCPWRHVQCRRFGCSLGPCSRPELRLRSHRRQNYKKFRSPTRSAVDLWIWSELEGACVGDDENDLSLELLDLSSVWFSWNGGKACAVARCFFRLPRRGAFSTMSQGTPGTSGNNEVSERFVGSSLRIVLPPMAPICPKKVLGVCS